MDNFLEHDRENRDVCDSKHNRLHVTVGHTLLRGFYDE